jgi:NADH-quinone oxidoreductase subunit L
MSAFGVTFFWLAPLMPLTVFALLAVGLNHFGRLATGLAIAAMAGSLLLSAAGLVAAAQGRHASVSLPWLASGGYQLTLALWLDPLSAVMATLVSLVGLIVFLYAATYMAQDQRRGRFFAEFSLFTGTMLTLVFAADIITLFIAWELVGLCSYLLIGFWFERPGAPQAASKAFFITRLGDLAFLAGLLLLIGMVGTGRITTILSFASQGKIAPALLLVIALLIFAGAAGKSAQFPLQGWLPDAMLGPTPVSALLHSATMVAAGVFLVARLYPLFQAAGPALAIVAWIGVITALIGGAAALVETDIKRTLAYSTISQIGLMFVGLGSGSLLAGMVLLIAQALYKATLFLGAGAVDHAVEGTGFERMGGLAKRMPLTAIGFGIAAAALAGLPVTLALPPKDPVLAAAWQANGVLFAFALVASLFTALYSTRAFALVFLGDAAEPAQQAHEAKPGLLVPLLLLAVLIPFGLLANAALLGQPLSRLLNFPVPDVLFATYITLLVAVIGVLAGLWARVMWPKRVEWPILRAAVPLFAGEFGLKTVYRGFTRLGFWIVYALATFDRAVFDAATEAVVKATLGLVRASARFDVRRVNAAVTGLGKDILAFSQRVRVLQTGRIENYLLAVFLWGLGVITRAVILVSIR